MLHACICALTLASSNMHYNEQKSFKPFFDKIEAPEEEDTIIAYDMAASPHFRFMAEQITSKKTRESHYMAFYTLNSLPRKPNTEILWTTLSLKEAAEIFSKLQEEHQSIQNILEKRRKNLEKSLEKNKPVKTCAKKEERTEIMYSTTYTQKKDDVTRTAQRIFFNGKNRYGCTITGTKDERTAKEVFNDLAKIYNDEHEEPA